MDRVVFAEAGKDFVDILLSFLTLPLGTMVHITGKQSSMHCMDRLYQSVENLDGDFLVANACRSMLLHPINFYADKCKTLPINIDVTRPRGYFICETECSCGQVSLFHGALCDEGKPMNVEVRLKSGREGTVDEGGFLKRLTRFTITDDMVISQASIEGILPLLARFGSECKLDEKEVKVTSSHVLRLLKRCMNSRTALTDVFLVEQQNATATCFQPIISTTMPRASSRKIRVKLVLNKRDRTLVFAEANQDFVDLLFSFLIYPLGTALRHLGGHSHVSCMDNLYKSTESLCLASCIKGECIEMLLNPKLPPSSSSMSSKLITIDEAARERYYMCRNEDCKFSWLSDVANVQCKCKSITNKRLILAAYTGKFLRSASYVVTDDLVATPISSSIALLNLFKDVKEGVDVKTVDIGEEEALALLKASLSSKTALTDALLSKQELGADGTGKVLGGCK